MNTTYLDRIKQNYSEIDNDTIEWLYSLSIDNHTFEEMLALELSILEDDTYLD